MAKRRKVSLLEVIIGLFVFAGLLAFVLSILDFYCSHGPAWRVPQCMANLNGIGKALVLYRGANDDHFPFISNVDGMIYDVHSSPLTESVWALDGDPAGDGKRLNPTDNLALLVAEGFTSEKMFLCPEVSRESMERNAPDQAYGWRDGDKLYMDYAYHLGYANTKDGPSAAKLPLKYVGEMEDEVAMLADRPGRSLDKLDESCNHGTAGVCVLKGAQNVNFHKETVFAGMYENNIYTADLPKDSSTPDGSLNVSTPVNKFDSVLIPAK